MSSLVILDDTERRRERRRQEVDHEEKMRLWSRLATYGASILLGVFVLSKVGECMAPVLAALKH